MKTATGTPLVSAGTHTQLGVSLTDTGVNVAVFSAHGERVEFCLFDSDGARELARFPLPERTGDIHHGHIAGIGTGARYGLRVHGPYAPDAGHRFNPAKLLADPCASTFDRPFALHPAMFSHPLGGDPRAFDATDSAPFCPKAVVAAADGAASPHRSQVPWSQSILYELNIRGFSKRNGKVPDALRGTFAGLAHPASLTHLTDLGITTVELMPAAAWVDETHLTRQGLVNAWGYNPVTFGAPDPKLAPGGWNEVRNAISAMHDAGLEVILDVVLNHSGEGDELGPTLSFRGLDNASYYRLIPGDEQFYINDMGCGNCLALDRPHLVRLAMDNLRRWARAGIDGFRFDLATALGRRADGFDATAPLLSAIDQDPELSTVKMIAEPWDIGPGGYQLGQFPSRWGEWNDRYRDTIRQFWAGHDSKLSQLATRIAGSDDVFPRTHRPSRSVNFITAHDGFTLHDLVSYRDKHNGPNGENNRDGTDANHSWNHGVEGPSDVPDIQSLRRADQISLLATLLISRGTPMLAMGAETGHSQSGNNNAYAQDNETAWLDWDNVDSDLHAAASALIALRKSHPALHEDRFLTGQSIADDMQDVVWLRADGQPMRDEDWYNAAADTLIVMLGSRTPATRALIVLNRSMDTLDVTLPPARAGRRWRIAFAPGSTNDTELTGSVTVPRRSVVILDEEDRRSRAGGPDADVVEALATHAGITAEWWDHGGTLHHVSQQTKRALLTGMGLDLSSRSSAADALHALTQRHYGGLPETAHGLANRAAQITLRKPDAIRPPPHRLLIEDEAGHVIRAEIDARAFTPDGSGLATEITLPPLDAGRYIVREDADATRQTFLTIAPERCYRPDMPRSFGLSAQVYTLRSAQDQGIGDLTSLAELSEQAARAGAVTVGINPLHALFARDPERASPYHPSDRRYLEPTAIDIRALDHLPTSPACEAWLAAHSGQIDALRGHAMIDHNAVAALKSEYLSLRHAAFVASSETPLHACFHRFCEAGGDELKRFCTFRALERHMPGPWQSWPAQYADSAMAAHTSFAVEHAEAIAAQAFMQWIAECQLADVAARAKRSGLSLGLYRDLAVGCAPDGAEAWANPLGYATGASVGAPPDPFSAQGQIWGLPPPNPLTIAAGGYANFRNLIAANMRHAGLLRIDHVMGLTRLYCVPEGARGDEGAYVNYPRDALLAELALESQRAECLVVGEDLGTVPDGFRQALAEKAVLSYRVLYFERDGNHLRAPETYPEDAVACVSTHDLPTLAGWWQGTDLEERAALGHLPDLAAARRDRAQERVDMLDALCARGLIESGDPEGPLTPEIAAAVHAFVAATPSLLACVQADDLSGETVAVNLPGTDRERPNWRRRLTQPVEALTTSPLARTLLAAMAERARAAPAP